MPTTVDQYKIGSLYMTAQRMKEESQTTKGEGIETVKNEPFENDKESGQYTYKIMHFKSRIPKFLRWALPDKYCHCHEKSWNAYPHYHTEYSVPGMGDNLLMHVMSWHVEFKPDEKFPKNLLNLSKEDLKARKVVWLDILDSKPKSDKKEWDVHGWTCPSSGINEPLVGRKKNEPNEDEPPEWTKHFNGPMMCAVKVVKLNFHWRGLQTMVEKYATNTLYHNLFLDSHRAMTKWMDQWGNMTLEQVREFERQRTEETNALTFDKDDDKEDVPPPDGPPPDVKIEKDE